MLFALATSDDEHRWDVNVTSLYRKADFFYRLSPTQKPPLLWFDQVVLQLIMSKSNQCVAAWVYSVCRAAQATCATHPLEHAAVAVSHVDAGVHILSPHDSLRDSDEVSCGQAHVWAAS